MSGFEPTGIKINGQVHTFFHDSEIKDFFESRGIDFEDLRNAIHAYENIYESTAFEGLIQDDLYSMQEAVEYDMEEFDNIIKRLEGPSKKGNTRADIAAELETLRSNLWGEVNTCRIYDINDVCGKRYQQKGKNMGCDMHAYIETKRKNNDGNWQVLPLLAIKYSDRFPSILDFYSGRDYELFGWLTGGIVRCDTDTALDAPRGIPQNVDYEIEKEYNSWNGDAHSASYFTLEELKEAYSEIPKKVYEFDAWGESTTKKVKNEFRKRVKCFLNTIEVLVETIGWFDDDEIRIVFWFDS